MRTALVIIVLVLATTGLAAYYTTHVAASSPAGFRTVSIQRGTLLTTIGATGTLEPEEVVNVGAQVAGLIVEFGPDDSPSILDYVPHRKGPCWPDHPRHTAALNSEPRVNSEATSATGSQGGSAETEVERGKALRPARHRR